MTEKEFNFDNRISDITDGVFYKFNIKRNYQKLDDVCEMKSINKKRWFKGGLFLKIYNACWHGRYEMKK